MSRLRAYFIRQLGIEIPVIGYQRLMKLYANRDLATFFSDGGDEVHEVMMKIDRRQEYQRRSDEECIALTENSNPNPFTYHVHQPTEPDTQQKEEGSEH